MVCRDEYITESNSVGEDLFVYGTRLERIAAIWQDRCAVKYNKWVDQYNQRIAELEAQEEADEAFVQNYTTWWAQVMEVRCELNALVKKFEDYEDVTPADWDAITTGKERKVFALIAPDFPKWKWPPCVPYLNMIGLMLWEEEQRQRYVSSIKRYHAVMQELKVRSQMLMEPNRVAGDMPPGTGLQVPAILKQVRHWRETQRAEASGTGLTPLQNGPASSEKWNAVLENMDRSADNEAKDRVLELVHTVDRLHFVDEQSDGLNDDVVDAIFAQDVGNEDELFLPYDY